MINMKESEIPKFLAEELCKEPFNLNLNLISFTSLQGDALMKVFQTVLIDIQPKLQEVFDEGSRSDKLQEMMELLRVLKFWPKCFDQQTLTIALEAVNQEIIWDTMGWLLTRRDELKKRAYLSQFLVKVNIPDDFMLDNDMQELYEEYESKITEFKTIHKKLEEVKKNKGIKDLVNDLKAVEKEIDSCSRKLDIMKSNVGEIPGRDELLQLAEELRHTRNEKNRLRSQIFVEERKLWCLDKKAYFLSNKLHELHELNSHSSPEGLLERIEQDSEILKFIVRHKIPQDIEEAERKIQSMKLALTAAPEFPSDLEPTRARIYDIQKDIQRLELEIKLKDTDASLTFARQKANQNKKKKLELLEELEELRKDMLEHQNILRTKRDERKRLYPDGIPCLSTRDYKEYVKTMKVKAAKYKAMRAELSTIHAEVGVLTSTKSILDEEFKQSVEKLKELEAELGLVGFSCVHERVSQKHSGQSLCQNDDNKMDHLYEMTEKGRDLLERVKAKRQEIEPLSKGVIEAKQEIKTLDLHQKRLQNAFEVEMGPVMESNRRFETRASKIREEMVQNQEDISRMTSEMPVIKASLQRAYAEAELLKSNPTCLRSFKNRMLTRIVDQERLQKTLNQEMSQLEQTQAHDKSQLMMWADLKKLVEAKKRAFSNRDSDSQEDINF